MCLQACDMCCPVANAVFCLYREASTNIPTVWGKTLSRRSWIAVRQEVLLLSAGLSFEIIPGLPLQF